MGKSKAFDKSLAIKMAGRKNKEIYGRSPLVELVMNKKKALKKRGREVKDE